MLNRVFLAAAMLCAINAFANPSPTLVHSLLAQAPGLHADALKAALESAEHAAKRGLVKNHQILTVIDYSIRSSEPRLFVFDLKQERLLFRELCAHGKAPAMM